MLSSRWIMAIVRKKYERSSEMEPLAYMPSIRKKQSLSDRAVDGVNIMGLMPCSVYTCTFHAKVAT
jgi:hypothetical protein